MSGSTAWMDAIPRVQPPPGMDMPAPSGGSSPDTMKFNGADIPIVKVRPGATTDITPGGSDASSKSSWMDSIPRVQPPPGMTSETPSSAIPPGNTSGLSANLGAGLKEGVIGAISSIAGAPSDMVTRVPNMALRSLGLPEVPQASDQIATALQNISLPSSTVTAATPGQEIGRAAARGVGGMMVGGLGGAAAGVPALEAAMSPVGLAQGAVGGAAGEAAREAVPERYQGAAEFLGNVAGGAATGLAANAGRAGGNLIARKVGEMGIGPNKQTIGGVSATQSQVNAAGGQVSSALGSEGRNIIERAADSEQEARDLEAKIADPSTPTDEGAAAQARLSEIQGRRINLVPNSEPTTAQLAPTAGAVALEKAHRVASPEQFNERAAAQNNARVQAIQNVQPGGNPGTVAPMLRGILDNIDQQGQGVVSAASKGVRQATEGLGATGTPDAIGEGVRQPLIEANKAAKARETKLWQAIDPEGKLALPLGNVQETARGLMGEMDPNLGDAASGQEMQILSGAAALPSVVPFRNAQRLRSNIGFAERALRVAPGNDQSLRRLGILKSSLDDAISNAAESAAASDGGIAERLGALGEQNGPVTVGRSGQSAGESPAGSTSGVAGAGGVSSNSQGGLGGGQGGGAVAAEAAISHLPGGLSRRGT